MFCVKLGLLCTALLLSGAALAQDAGQNLKVGMTFITHGGLDPLPLSLARTIPDDLGLAGARTGLEDNRTTGRFLKQDYDLSESLATTSEDVVRAARDQLAAGIRLIIADLPADDVLAIADLPEAAGAVIFNTRAMDDRLRGTDCRANVFHVMPSRAMKADALAQYLMWKQWPRWALIHGTRPADLEMAQALRHAAEKFAASLVGEKAFEGEAPSRRTDTGAAHVQKQIPVFTQDLPEYDVLLAADESEVFGEYLPFRTWAARPVAGTQGLVPTAWSRVHEQWGGTQMQTRFEKLAHRAMEERDYTAWAAVRAIGEAVTRTGKADPAALRAYFRGESFKLGAFKGEALTFRTWDQQMRQPILLATATSLVSVSPQDGYIHERTPLDTLGMDEGDSQCALQD